MENEDLLDDELEVDSNDEVAELRARAERAEAQAEKYKSRFKAEKAKQSQSPTPADNAPNVDEIVDRKLAEQMFYQTNETAKAHQSEIKEYQTKYNLDPERAFKLFLAETKPEALQRTPEATIDGHTTTKSDQEDWRKMSDAEFDEKVMGFKK